MIEEKKLIEDIKSKYCDLDFMDSGVIQLFIDEINKQPQADKWIPVEERLPSEEGFYLVSVDAPYKPIRVYMYKKMGDEFKWFDGSISYALLPHFVEAWTNLPQPYKKEGAENG